MVAVVEVVTALVVNAVVVETKFGIVVDKVVPVVDPDGAFVTVVDAPGVTVSAKVVSDPEPNRF